MLGPIDQPLESIETLLHMTSWALSEIKQHQPGAEIRTSRRGSKASHKGDFHVQKGLRMGHNESTFLGYKSALL